MLYVGSVRALNSAHGGMRRHALGIGISALSTKEVTWHKKHLSPRVGSMLAPAAFAQITISGQVKDGFEMYKLGAGKRLPRRFLPLEHAFPTSPRASSFQARRIWAGGRT